MDKLLNRLQETGVIIDWTYDPISNTLNIIPYELAEEIKIDFWVSKQPKWEEFESDKKIRTFRLGDEPEIIFVIPNRKDEYIVVHADAYDSHTGKTEFPISSEGIKEKYGIDLHEKRNKQLTEDFEAYYLNQKPLGLKNTLAHIFSKEVPYIKDAPVFFMKHLSGLLFYDDNSKKIFHPDNNIYYKNVDLKSIPIIAKTWKTNIKFDQSEFFMNGMVKLFPKIKKELEKEYDKIKPDAFFIHGIDISADGYVMLQYAKRKVFE